MKKLIKIIMSKNQTILKVAFMFCLISVLSSGVFAAPFEVWPVQEEPQWQSWGYTVDNQDWANWFAVTIPWGSDVAMSGIYTVEEDFLFQVDPSTSGLANPALVYGQNWWNHRDTSGTQVYGLGEFFDAGSQAGDKSYAISLNLSGGTGTWNIFYDADRDLTYTYSTVNGEHTIFEGTVTSYWNNGGYFYGILTDTDGVYNGYFTAAQDDGTPNLINGFHAGSGEPIPAPGALILGGIGAGLVSWLRRRRAL